MMTPTQMDELRAAELLPRLKLMFQDGYDGEPVQLSITERETIIDALEKEILDRPVGGLEIAAVKLQIGAALDSNSNEEKDFVLKKAAKTILVLLSELKQATLSRPVMAEGWSQAAQWHEAQAKMYWSVWESSNNMEQAEARFDAQWHDKSALAIRKLSPFIADGVERRNVLEDDATVERVARALCKSGMFYGNGETMFDWEDATDNARAAIRALSPTTGAQKPCPQEVK